MSAGEPLICYICETPVYAGEEYDYWNTLERRRVPVHKLCLDRNPKPVYAKCRKCGIRFDRRRTFPYGDTIFRLVPPVCPECEALA